MNVLITGGAGYIGSHTAKVLSRADLQPVVVDNLSRGHREAVRWGPFIEADISDRATLRRAFREHRIDAVIHFAGYAYVGESMQCPELYFHNNFVKTLSLLETMREMQVRSIIFSSTCATYGNPRLLPISEAHEQHPSNPYGESKLMVERVLQWYSSIHGFSCIALRYFNAAGADPDGELGEEHDPETHLIPLAISATMGTAPQLEVYGTDYDTPDGTAIRDYIHVSDLAQAHVAALRHLSGSRFCAFNLGTGAGHSVREVITMLERVSGRKVPFREAPRRPGDPACLVAAAERAANGIGWRPRHSALEEIIHTAWQWKSHRRQVSSSV